MGNTIYKNFMLFVVKAGAFIVPLIPLYIANSLFFPYITGKAFIFRILAEIIFAAWVWLAIFYPEYRPRKNPLLISISIFLGVVILATIFGINPARSFWSNYERMEGLVAYFHLFAYFLVLGHVFKKSDWIIFFNIFVLAGLAENIYALIQKLGYLPSPQGGFRVDGTIGNPTYLAAYLIFAAAFSGWLFLRAVNKWARYFYVAMAGFSLLSIYFTATRGVAVALAAGGVAGILFYLLLVQPTDYQRRWYRKLAILGLVLILLGSFSIKVFKDSSVVKNSEVLSRFAAISFSEARTRFTIWKMGFIGAKENPILGWGPENYPVIFARFYNPSLYSQEPWFDRSHNIVLDWLINAGILGILSYLSILMIAGHMIWKLYRQGRFSAEEMILLSVLLLVYFLQNLFVFDQIATYISYFSVLAYIYNVSISGAEYKEPVKPFIRSASADVANYGIITAGFLAIPLVLMVYFVNARPFLANKSLLNALRLQNMQNFEGSFKSYEQAFAYNTLGNQEIREQFVRFAVNAGGLPNVSVEFKNKILSRAIEEVEKGVKENILDPRAYLFLGSIYSRVGLLDPAIQVLNKAAELSPKKQQIYFELADAYLRKGENNNAVRVLEKTFNDAPSFDQARMNLVAAYILNNQQDKADQLLLEAYKKVNIADQLLIQVYSAIKNYERLLGVWQAFVNSDPLNAEHRMSLASAYLLANQEEAAIGELEEAIRLNPGFKAEGENLISEIKRRK